MTNFNPIEAEKYLKGINYPASRDDLLECAKKNGVNQDQEISNLLQKLPDRQFNRPTDVTHELSSLQKGR